MSQSQGKKSLLNTSRIIRGAVTAIVLVGGGIYVSRHWEEFSSLAEVRFVELAALGLCTMAFYLAIGFAFNLLALSLNIRLSAVEWIGLTFLGSALNYLGPVRPGAVVKAAYLKHKGMAYSRFSALLAASGLLRLLCLGVSGLLVVALIWLERGTALPWLMVLCLALIAIPAVPWLLPASRVRWRGRISYLLNNALEGFDQIRSRRGLTIAVVALVLVQNIIAAFCCMIAFRALGFQLDLLTALALGIFVGISNLVSITPNNIGIQEMVIASLYSVVGMDFGDGLVGAGLLRAIHLLLAFLCAPPLTCWMLSNAHVQWSSLVSMPSSDRNDTADSLAGSVNGHDAGAASREHQQSDEREAST